MKLSGDKFWFWLCLWAPLRQAVGNSEISTLPQQRFSPSLLPRLKDWRI